MVSRGTNAPAPLARLRGYAQPAILITVMIFQHIMTILTIVFWRLEPLKLLQPQKVRDEAFGTFWLKFGPSTVQDIPAPIIKYLKELRGTILDVGPGSGELLSRYDHTSIDVAYGAEHGTIMHPQLLSKAQELGWGGKYRALACGAQPESLIPALAKEGLLRTGSSEGVFDSVVCLRVLCGVPRPDETIAGLYRLLKPGGKLVVMEHVVNPWRTKEGSALSRGLQALYAACGWSFWMGNCHIQQDTRKMLLDAGGKTGWSSKELSYSDGWGPVPWLCGSFTKSSQGTNK